MSSVSHHVNLIKGTHTNLCVNTLGLVQGFTHAPNSKKLQYNLPITTLHAATHVYCTDYPQKALTLRPIETVCYTCWQWYMLLLFLICVVHVICPSLSAGQSQ